MSGPKGREHRDWQKWPEGVLPRETGAGHREPCKGHEELRARTNRSPSRLTYLAGTEFVPEDKAKTQTPSG